MRDKFPDNTAKGIMMSIAMRLKNDGYPVSMDGINYSEDMMKPAMKFIARNDNNLSLSDSINLCVKTCEKIMDKTDSLIRSYLEEDGYPDDIDLIHSDQIYVLENEDRFDSLEDACAEAYEFHKDALQVRYYSDERQ